MTKKRAAGEGYMRLRRGLLRHISDGPLRGEHLGLLAYLLLLQGGDAVVQVPTRRVARDLGWGASTVSRLFRELQAWRYLERLAGINPADPAKYRIVKGEKWTRGHAISYRPGDPPAARDPEVAHVPLEDRDPPVAHGDPPVAHAIDLDPRQDTRSATGRIEELIQNKEKAPTVPSKMRACARRPAKKPARPRPEKLVGYQETVALYFELFENATGSKPTWRKADGRLLGGLLRSHGADEVQKRLRCFDEHRQAGTWFADVFVWRQFARHFDACVVPPGGSSAAGKPRVVRCERCGKSRDGCHTPKCGYLAYTEALGRYAKNPEYFQATIDDYLNWHPEDAPQDASSCEEVSQ